MLGTAIAVTRPRRHKSVATPLVINIRIFYSNGDSRTKLSEHRKENVSSEI